MSENVWESQKMAEHHWKCMEIYIYIYIYIYKWLNIFETVCQCLSMSEPVWKVWGKSEVWQNYATVWQVWHKFGNVWALQQQSGKTDKQSDVNLETIGKPDNIWKTSSSMLNNQNTH